MFVAVVCSALVTVEAFDIWFSYREKKPAHSGPAGAGKGGCSEHRPICEGNPRSDGLGYVSNWDHSTFEDWHLDAVRLLRQVPAVTEVAQLSGSGHELFRISRQAMDVVASQVESLARRTFHTGDGT